MMLERISEALIASGVLGCTLTMCLGLYMYENIMIAFGGLAWLVILLIHLQLHIDHYDVEFSRNNRSTK